MDKWIEISFDENDKMKIMDREGQYPTNIIKMPSYDPNFNRFKNMKRLTFEEIMEKFSNKPYQVISTNWEDPVFFVKYLYEPID